MAPTGSGCLSRQREGWEAEAVSVHDADLGGVCTMGDLRNTLSRLVRSNNQKTGVYAIMH
jgi:hypothetical protein